jgi:hypothetical protein
VGDSYSVQQGEATLSTGGGEGGGGGLRCPTGGGGAKLMTREIERRTRFSTSTRGFRYSR